MKNTINKLKGSNILITGGCGFIGSHLVEQLIKLGVKKITIIDSLEYGKKENLGDLLNQVEIIKYKIGISEDNTLAKAIKNVDYLFHLAAKKHNQSINSPLEVLESNVNGSLKLFELAGQNNVKKVFFSSSLYVYEFKQNNPIPFSELEMSTPETIYGISKLACEHFLKYCYKKYGLEFSTYRIFFVYGPRQFEGTGYKSVIIKNFERILRNENPIVFGDGEQVLDYIYIDDVINAIIKIMESNCVNETFNLGSSIPMTINHLTDVMIKISGKRLKKIYGPADITNGTFRVADISKMKNLLSSESLISLEQGLQKTYNWLKNQTNL